MVILSGAGPSACAGITCPRVAAGGRPCGGGQHAAGVGQGGEEEFCLRSALWIHTEICSFKSENKVSKLVPG